MIPSLIDRRTGVVTETELYRNPPEWPDAFTMVAAHVADTNADGTWPSDRMSTGMGFGGAPAVEGAAVGEAVERYCGNFVPAELPRASYRSLRDRGLDAVDPTTILLYSGAQYASPGFDFVPLDADLPVRWAQGHDMVGGGARLVPASLVFPNFHATRYVGEPRVHGPVFAGLAAGRTRREAEVSAMAEIIERDAIEVWWRAGGPALAADPALLDGMDQATRARRDLFDLTVLSIPHRWRVPVIAVVLHDPELEILTVGTAARPTAAAAARKAAAEAISLRAYAKGLLTPDGGAWRAVELGLFGGDRLAPFRDDRRYTASFAPDLHDMQDLCCNAQYYLDPAAQKSVEWLRQPAPDHGTWLRPVTGDIHAAYVDRLSETGHTPVSVDLTTPDVARAGLHVVRVVAPGTYSNTVAAHPFRAGDRWTREPVHLGISDGPLAATQPIPPLPHT